MFFLKTGFLEKKSQKSCPNRVSQACVTIMSYSILDELEGADADYIAQQVSGGLFLD